MYGNAKIILSNALSKWLLVFAIGFLGINLLGTGCMTFLYNKRRRYADDYQDRWENEYQKAGKKSESAPWPYTHFIQGLGSVLRFLKVTVPIIAALLFIVSLFSLTSQSSGHSSPPLEFSERGGSSGR